MEGWMDSVPRLCASEDSPWLLDMSDPVERAGTYALVYLAVVQHWNAVCPDEWHARQTIPSPKATWAFARANMDLRTPAKKRKRSLEGHVPAKTLAACEKVPPSTVESSTAPSRVGAQPFCLQAL